MVEQDRIQGCLEAQVGPHLFSVLALAEAKTFSEVEDPNEGKPINM